MSASENLPPYFVEESVGYLLGRVRAQLAKSIDEALSAHGITHAQGGILLMLMSGRFDTASQLARELYIDAAAMTRMVDRLVKRDLVVRLQSGVDRRSLMLQLTVAGKTLAGQLPEIYIAARERNFAGLSAEELGFLKSLLRRILVNGEAAEPVSASS
ncbi:MarR family transcriptional regulator [Actimicrobium antarcticum]|uniref:MarR family transcriptional regulator n=1 Tax=Actimicrobium antarcticum TaxID=1051899 RepID=A0ABP7SP16_9BURK